jgi:mRNA interferase YafQ
LTVVESTRFAKELELQRKRGKDLSKLWPIIVALATRRPLEPRHRDHALTGDWSGYRECHIEPDWLLVYKTTDSELRLARTGTHSDLGF